MVDETNTNVYSRQESLEINRAQTVAIVGCGGIGMWVAYFLALAGVEKLELFDGDSVDVHNLNRLPLTETDIGKPKTVALAELLRRHRPNVEVIARTALNPEMPGHKEAISNSTWVVCCTDSLKTRRMTYELSVGFCVNYIECGAEGDAATVTFSPADFATDEEENPGYRSVPVFVGPCTLAASIAAYYVLKYSATYGGVTFNANWKDGDLVIGTVLDNDPNTPSGDMDTSPERDDDEVE